MNELYKTTTGWLIPRSHIGSVKGERFAVVELLEGDENHFVKTHTTYSPKEFRVALDLKHNERVEII